MGIPYETPAEFTKWVKYTHDRPFNDHRYAVDGTKLRQLGWEQKTSFKDGLRATVEWYRLFGERWWGDISKVLISLYVYIVEISQREIKASASSLDQKYHENLGSFPFSLISQRPITSTVYQVLPLPSKLPQRSIDVLVASCSIKSVHKHGIGTKCVASLTQSPTLVSGCR